MGEIFISHASADGALAGQVAEGLRRGGHDIFLDYDRVDGIAPGATWLRTLLRELQTCDAVVFLNSLAGQASMWCHSELVVAIDLGKRIYPLDLHQGVPSHPLLQSLQAIRLDTVVESSIDRLVASLDSDGLAGAVKLRWQHGRPPYPGLAAMDVADAGVFFGREDEIRGLVARTDGPLGQRDGDLVVVIGPSGAGKSSLVRAGLAARLAAPGSGWVVAAPFEPGIKPFDRLVSRLTALVPGQLADQVCRDRLLSGGMAGLGEWLIDHAGFPARRLLITVDEAEQLVTVTSPAERDEFLAALSAGMSPGSPVTVVMTVRSDRFDEMQRLPAIGAKIRSPFVIAAISRSRLAAVIEGPATRANLAFAPGLAGRLADDAIRGSSGETADALPFLAFTLREMYDLLAGQDRAVFAEDDYEQVGQIEGAITRRTLAAEASLPPESGPFLNQFLPRFVALSEDRPPAGRPVRRDRLTPAEREIVARLEDQRLLTGTGDTVRLAHERLITAWPRLAAAVADCRDDLLLQARIERQARDWQHGNGELPSRDATRAAAAWLGRTEADTVHGFVRDYVDAARRALRRRRAGTVSLLCLIVTLAVVASAVAVVAAIKSDDAIRQSQVAQSEAMAADAVSLFPANAPLAMLLSLAAYERDHTLQAGNALIQAAAQPLDDLLADGHPVASVAFSPDGRVLAAGDGSGHIGLWDLAHHRTKMAALAEGGTVSSIAFSPDGLTLAADNGSGSIGLWNLATGRRTSTLREGSPVNSIAFSPDGRTLAAGGDSDDLRLWNVATGQPIAKLFERSAADSIAFSPDGRTLAVGDFSGDIGLWNVATRRETAALVAGNAGDSVYSVAFSPDSRTIAAGDVNGDIGLWNVRTRRPIASLAEDTSVDSVAFSRNGQTLAAGDVSGDVVLWDVTTGLRITTLAEGSGVGSVAFSPDDQTLAAGDVDGDIGLWDVAPGQRTATLAGSSGVSSVAFSPDSRVLAAGENGGDIALWDVATGAHMATFADGSPVENVAFSRSGRVLAAGDNSGDVGLWQVSTNQQTAILPEGSGVTSVAFSPNGQTLAAGDNSGSVGLWDVSTNQQTAILPEGSGVTSVAFSPNGLTLAVGDDSGDVGLWNSTGQQTSTLPEGSGVTSVAFSPNGLTLAVGDDSGNADLWDLDTGRRSATLFDGSPVVSVAFSPNGQAIVTGDDAGNVGIWNADSGQLFGRLAERNTGGPVDSVTFSPDSQAVAAGQTSGGIALLRLNLSEPSQRFFTQLICGKVQENITRDQWAQYVPGEPYQKICPSYP